MKKYLSVFLVGIISGALILFFVNRKWPVDKIINNEIKSELSSEIHDSSGFASITSKLEQDGELFFYLNTAKIAGTIDKTLGTIKETIESSEETPVAKKKEAAKWFGFITHLLNDSGILNISGIGISSKEIEKGLTRSKFVVQHDPGKGDGLIWNLNGKSPGDLGFLDILPKDTVFTSFSDFNYSSLWNWIKEQAEKSGDDKIRFGVSSVETNLKNMGIELPALLKSLNGDSGFLITLDPENKCKFPVGSKSIEFPEPAFAFVFETSDDSIFNLLSKKIPDADIKKTKGEKTISIKAPQMPFTFSPAIIQDNNLLIIASTTGIAEKILYHDEGSGLKDSKEFKNLSTGIPDTGNGFTFMSSLLFSEIFRIQKQFDPGNTEANKNGMDLMKKLGLDLDKLAMFRVTSKTDEGYIITTNSTIKTEMLMLLPIASIGGIVAAITIPKMVMMNKKVNQEGQSQNLPSREL